jgi:hypothetical protein
MKFRSRRRIDRDLARRDAQQRLRESSKPTPEQARGPEHAAEGELEPSDDLDLDVARRLLGYDA